MNKFSLLLLCCSLGLWTSCNSSTSDSYVRGSNDIVEDDSTHLMIWQWSSLEDKSKDTDSALLLMTQDTAPIDITAVESAVIPALEGETELEGGTAVLGTAESFPGVILTLSANDSKLNCKSSKPIYLDQAAGIKCDGEDGTEELAEPEKDKVAEPEENSQEFGACQQEKLEKCLFYCQKMGPASSCFNEKEKYGNCDDLKGTGKRFDRPKNDCGGSEFTACAQNASMVYCAFKNWCALSDSDPDLNKEAPDSNFDMCHKQ